MILDWRRNCIKIMETGLLSREDPSDNKVSFKQEVVYIRYLSYLGYTYDQCLARWLEIKNGIAAQLSLSDDDEDLSIQFHRIYLKSKSKFYSFVEDPPMKPIFIYTSEVKKLNSIKADKWVREFFLMLLMYYKFSKQTSDTVEYSTTLVNWILRQVEYGEHKFRSYRDARGAITKVMREAPFKFIKFAPITKKEKYSTYTIPFAHGYGDVAMVIATPDQMTEAFTLLRDDTACCTKCGAVFKINSKTKRDLCEDCYKKYRRKYKTDKDREYYHRDK